MDQRIKVELYVDVPGNDWIEYLTKYTDIFGQDYCGYWARGVARDPDKGWLVWEDDGEHDYDAEPNRAKAIAAWKADDKLLPGWHRLDRQAAINAYIEGVKRWGLNWMDGDNNDARGYDTVVQLALLGEVRYG
jgi:hypothetical protein